MSTPQIPLGSGFTAASTASDVMRGVDLTGRTAIVTGGYSGLGRETVRVFLEAGARVIVPARDAGRAAEAMKDVARAEIWPMDLLDPASIDAFADRFLAQGLPLHILVNSAGIMALPELTRDRRGHELQFATNHLGHFQLARRLWPALAKARSARIVSVSSRGHRFSPVVFEDIDYERRAYTPLLGYGQSKTANILFAVEADARGQRDGIRAFAIHPGSIADTGLGKHMSIEALKKQGVLDAEGQPIIDPAKGLKTVPQGASTQVWCAVSPQLDGKGGVYCENTEVATLRPAETGEAPPPGGGSGGVWPHAVDTGAAAQLWAVSEQMILPGKST